MSNENSEKKENIFNIKKGWNDFVSTIQNGFQNFQKDLEEQSKKNVENWEEAKGKVGNFFKKMKDNWDKQVKEWQEGMEEFSQQNKEQWEAGLQKIQGDYNNWQENVRQDFKDGVKSWNRGMIRGAWMFMIIMIPILVVLFVIAYIFQMIMGSVP